MALDAAKSVSPAISTELIDLAGMNLDPYLAVKVKSIDKEDDFPALEVKLIAPEVRGIIIGSPVYMGLVSSPCKAFMERCISLRQAGFPLQDKIGGAIAVGAGRNTGLELVLEQLVMFMLSQGMAVVGDGRPTSHWGGAVWAQKDEISGDETGLTTVRGTGRHVAELALWLAAAPKPV